jgi:short subunit dehydrogenase-like uncharacterized protein
VPGKPLLIYGATGYTGRLIAHEAAARGVRAILAGRDVDAIRELANALGMPHRAFPLGDLDRLAAGLEGVGAVLHCAGPFSHTSEPMASACLRQRVHYLDITGEIAVFEALAARRAEASAAGVVLLPGVGFDVVPSDSLAAHLARRLPSATHLDLAIAFHGGVSRGTATTMLETMARGEGTLVRRDGRLQHIPFGSASIDVDYGRGVSSAMAASWGDVATAYHSTGIPNVSVYMTFAGATGYLSKFAGPLVSLLRLPGATAIAGHLIRMGEPGPDEVTRTRGYCLLWGRVRDADGNAVTSRMRTPEGYTFTVRSALWAAERVVAGRVTPGFHTPTTAFGADVALKFDGVERSDVAD